MISNQAVKISLVLSFRHIEQKIKLIKGGHVHQ